MAVGGRHVSLEVVSETCQLKVVWSVDRRVRCITRKRVGCYVRCFASINLRNARNLYAVIFTAVQKAFNISQHFTSVSGNIAEWLPDPMAPRPTNPTLHIVLLFSGRIRCAVERLGVCTRRYIRLEGRSETPRARASWCRSPSGIDNARVVRVTLTMPVTTKISGPDEMKRPF